MTRIKRGVTTRAKHKRILENAKGYYGRRKNTIRIPRQAVEKAGQYAYRDRKVKKRSFRALWIQRINAAVRTEGLTYGQFIHALKLANIDLDRKVLADIAMHEGEAFKGCLRLRDDRAERFRFVHCDVGQDLPVEVDVRKLERVDELTVGQAFRSDGGVDALDPQGAEAPLLNLAIAIGVLPGLFDGLAGDTDRVLATAVIALRRLQDPLVLCAGGNTPFDACHGSTAPFT